MIENIRGKYVYWSMKVYVWITTLWWNHITRQKDIHWDNMDPELRRQVEWHIKREL
jgi:hypothetical protein